MEKKQITIDELKSMAWEIHDNWTDGNRKDSDDDSQLLYKSYVATIDGHKIEIVYTEEEGYRLEIDGKTGVLYDEDEERISVFDIANVLDRKLNDRLSDLDAIYERYHAEQDVA